MSLSVGMLSSCALAPSPTTETLAYFLSDAGASASPKVDPRLRYLRVEVQGHPPGTLVLGYVDPSPDGPVEVWYSANREVIKIQNGRIIATAGLPLDWSGTRFEPAPVAWPAVGADGTDFRRLHDEPTQYRTGIVDAVRLHPWLGELPQAFTESLPTTLPSSLARTYTWYQETYTRVPPKHAGGEAGTSLLAQAPAWFAWGPHLGQWTVVYSYQCLTPDFCLKLQRWPPQEAPS